MVDILDPVTYAPLDSTDGLMWNESTLGGVKTWKKKLLTTRGSGKLSEKPSVYQRRLFVLRI